MLTCCGIMALYQKGKFRKNCPFDCCRTRVGNGQPTDLDFHSSNMYDYIPVLESEIFSASEEVVGYGAPELIAERQKILKYLIHARVPGLTLPLLHLKDSSLVTQAKTKLKSLPLWNSLLVDDSLINSPCTG